MKEIYFLILLVLCFFSSCKGQNDSVYIKRFTDNEAKYNEVISFLKNNKDTLLKLQCNPYIKGSAASISLDDINRKKCYRGFENKLNAFFDLKLFETIRVYADSDIELLVDFVPVKNMADTETSKYLLYTEKPGLPGAYESWKIKKRINEHWWYLEDTDAGF